MGINVKRKNLCFLRYLCALRFGIIWSFGLVSIFFLATKWRINPSLRPCPPFSITLSNLRKQFANTVSSNRVALVLEREVGIGTPDKEGSSSQDNVKLCIDGAMGLEGNSPNDDDNDGDSDFHQ